MLARLLLFGVGEQPDALGESTDDMTEYELFWYMVIGACIGALALLALKYDTHV